MNTNNPHKPVTTVNMIEKLQKMNAAEQREWARTAPYADYAAARFQLVTESDRCAIVGEALREKAIDRMLDRIVDGRG